MRRLISFDGTSWATTTLYSFPSSPTNPSYPVGLLRDSNGDFYGVTQGGGHWNGGTLYRLLFLAAVLLFVFTFLINTVAEVVRQRLRTKYSQY